MKIRRVLAVFQKECLQIIRDWRSLALGIMTPLFLLLLFGFALTLDVSKVAIVIQDQSNTQESRNLISQFTASDYFAVVQRVDDPNQINQFIDEGKAIGALIIPPEFARELNLNQNPAIQFIIDGSDANMANIALGYAQSIVTKYSQKLAIDSSWKQGKVSTQAPLIISLRTWFNPNLESKNNIVPGLIAIIMMVISAMLTSLTIAREWERGTMEQLISTPVKVSELILGKLMPYFFIGMFDVFIIVIVGHFVFQVTMAGSYFLLFMLAPIFLIGSLALGICISIIAKNQLLASQMAMAMTFLPSFLLSGFISPISNMPEVLQGLSYLIPARYFVSMMINIYTKGIGIASMMLETILLLTFAVAMVILALTKFQKKIIE